jgi:chromosome partitioning protein
MQDNRLARRILADKIRGLRGYDYVILDFSPSVSLVGECGLLCAHELIVPVAMNYLALVGTRQVVETLKTIGQVAEHRLRLYLVVPTFYRSRLRKDREIMTLLNRYFRGRVAEPIRPDVKISEASGHGKNIYEYAPRSAGASDYARLVERVARDG